MITFIAKFSFSSFSGSFKLKDPVKFLPVPQKYGSKSSLRIIPKMRRAPLFFHFAFALIPKESILDLKIIDRNEDSIILEWREGVALSKYFIIIYKEFGNFEYEYVSEENNRLVCKCSVE